MIYHNFRGKVEGILVAEFRKSRLQEWVGWSRCTAVVDPS